MFAPIKAIGEALGRKTDDIMDSVRQLTRFLPKAYQF
jgi:hypothetical protein